MDDLDKVCEKFNNNYLCHKRINHFPTCQISLLYNHTTECSLKLADPRVRYSFGSFNFLFFQHPTNSLVECPDDQFHTIYHGLVSFEQISKCNITTTKFTLLPKSPANSVSTMVQRTQPIFVLNNEWIKVTVEFDNKKQKKQTAIEPNPWKNNDKLSNQDQEIKLFGTHTILVFSTLHCHVFNCDTTYVLVDHLRHEFFKLYSGIFQIHSCYTQYIQSFHYCRRYCNTGRRGLYRCARKTY
jgi:hypothetical protein